MPQRYKSKLHFLPPGWTWAACGRPRCRVERATGISAAVTCRKCLTALDAETLRNVERLRVALGADGARP